MTIEMAVSCVLPDGELSLTEGAVAYLAHLNSCALQETVNFGRSVDMESEGGSEGCSLALSPLVKSKQFIFEGDEYVMYHGQKTPEHETPVVQGRRNESYTQTIQAALLDIFLLIIVFDFMSGGGWRSSEESFGCYYYCCPPSPASCLDHRDHLYPEEAEEKGHLLHQPTEDQHVWTAEPHLL